MATRQAKQSSNLPARKIQPTTATIEEAKGVTNLAENVDTPDFLKSEGVVKRENTGGFNDVVNFHDTPGKWIVGKWFGGRSAIGPNASMLYDLEVEEDDGTKRMCSFWGSTILDKRISEVKPQIGDYLYVQYLGTVNTKRNLSPAKDWRVAVLNESALRAYLKNRRAS